MSIMEYTAPGVEQCVLWLRYIGDLFIIWNGSEESARHFVEMLMDNTLNLDFTYNVSNKTIEFLDVQVEMCEGMVTSRLYRKPTAGNTLLHALSSHPDTLKWSIPFGELLRQGGTAALPWNKKSCSEDSENVDTGSAYSNRQFPE